MLEGQSTRSSARETFGQRVVRWTRDPTLRFFAIGALLFVVHRVATGDPRVIAVTPGVRADLKRRFRDHRGREPSPAELEQELSAWKRDEALYREALHD